jgi:hypothetical protein
MRALFGASHLVLALLVTFQGCGKAIRERWFGKPSCPTVGQPAPEIVGEDIDGAPFKLSDFRGRVVVLNFWGDW